MKNLLFLMAGVLFSGISLFAQDLEYAEYTWEDDPKYIAVEAEEDDHEIVLKDKRALEFNFQDQKFVQFYMQHKIIYVNSEKGVETNNQIYLPGGSDDVIMKKMARSITPDGKVITLTDNDIKEAKDEESGRVTRYFAIEGLTEGSIVETLFMWREYPDYTGNIERLQDDSPKRDVSFELITPEKLRFAVRSINGLPEMQLDSTRDDKNYWQVAVDSMPKLPEEPFAAYVAHLQAVEYKLDANLANGQYDMFSFGEAAKNYYASIYDIHKKSKKKAAKVIKLASIDVDASKEDQIRQLENWAKTTIFVVTSAPAEFSEIPTILSKNVASENGIMRVYGAVLNQLGIKHQIVLTCDRERMKFPEEFEAYHFLQEPLIYFPDYGTYLGPTQNHLRYGFVDPSYTHNNGLFIKTLKIGDISTGIGKVNFIDAIDHSKSYNNIFVTMDMTGDIAEPTLDLENHMAGHSSSSLQIWWNQLADDDKDEQLKSLLSYVLGEEEATEQSIENMEPTDYGNKPMVIKAQTQTSRFTEKAGNKYLVKVGELIGEQSELYDENEEPRSLPVENQFNRGYHRELTLILPDGYQITNLDDINMDVFHEAEGERTMQFVSSYTLDGNKLTITIDEWYNEIEYSVDLFETYRKVINAAADFNKLVLYLEKK